MLRILLTLAACALAAAPAWAQKHYGPGVTDTEIKIGETGPLSGGNSVSGYIARMEIPFFQMINDQGGINGRKVNLIVEDDAYVPAKTVERTRKLVEQDGVLLMFGSLGTPTNLAVRKYLNDNKVPQLFFVSGAPQFNDPKNYPWSISGGGSYVTEGRIEAEYILKTKPDAKIAVLFQDDDLGKSLLQGLRQQLGDKADTMIVQTQSYQATDPTVDSQIISLASTGATVFADYAISRAVAQAIRKSTDLGWKPLHIVPAAAAIPEASFKPAGYENAIGTVSITIYKYPSDTARWGNDADYKAFRAFFEKYTPNADPNSVFNSLAYGSGSLLVEALKRCGDELTRENVLKAVLSLDTEVPMYLPGIHFHVTPDDYTPFHQAQIVRFNGTTMELVGDVLSVR
jgi:branched-chain amino acid transport system substrate-binding protein